MILISQWYETSSEKRSKELRDARVANETSGIFDRTVYVDGRNKRWTYGDMLQIAARDYRGQLCVIANTDIVFDSTSSMIPLVCKENRVIALTRWESAHCPNMLGHLAYHSPARQWLFSGTQDAWAFIAGTIPYLMKEDFSMGVPGCEQAMLASLVMSGCEVISPSIDVRIRHFHSDAVDYEGVPTACGLYAYPKMTSISDQDGYALVHECPCRKCNPDGGDIRSKVVKTCK